MYTKTRSEELDISKGIAIFLVVWGHIIQYSFAGKEEFYENIIFRLIYGFHMPLFMIISGYLFFYSCEKYDLKRIVKKQFKNIIYPLFIWNIIFLGSKLLYRKIEINSFGDFLGLLNVSLRDLWFLWSIFIISILIAVVHLGGNNKDRLWIGYILIFAILIALPDKIQPSKTMNIWLYPYFLTGFIFAGTGGNVLRERIAKYKIKYGFIIIYPILIHYFHFRDYIYISKINPFCSEYGFKNQVSIDIFRWILGYTGIGFMMALIYKLSQITNIKKFLYLLFGRLGKITLQIYILQRLLLEEIFGGVWKKLVSKLGKNPLLHNMGLFNIVLSPVMAMVSLFAIYIIVLLIKRHNKWNKFLFNK